MVKKNIYETISAVMEDVGAVGKNSKNTQQGFMFRGIDAVMNALNPAMIKHKLFVVPEIIEHSREERSTAKGNALIYSICKIKYTFYAEDGSSVYAVVVGEGMDSGDKATNKAMSIAFKYACFQVFCIPTEEMKNADPDNECHEVSQKLDASHPTQQNRQAQKQPAKNAQLADAVTQQKLISEAKRTGYNLELILKRNKVQTIDQIPQSLADMYLKSLQTMKTKEQPEINEGFQSVGNEQQGLPFV